MSRISREQVDRVAELARLSLDDAEARAMERDLERILEYAAKLQALDTRGVEPTAHAIALATPLRRDEPGPVMEPERVVANAPRSAGTAFLVPKVIEEEGP
jgi:aspartyl-tRNA(Asn)/glutamyl-tRNA(Gln) amidotransferase subunit C